MYTSIKLHQHGIFQAKNWNLSFSNIKINAVGGILLTQAQSIHALQIMNLAAFQQLKNI